MFFILMYLGQLIGKGISSIEASFDDRALKRDAIKRKKLGDNELSLYIDRKGVTRDINSNAIRNVYTINGETVIRDEMGKTLRNLSIEESYDNFIKAKKERNPYVTVIKWGADKHNGTYDECRGERYRDLKTEEEYVARQIPCINEFGTTITMCMFMNAKTGEYVRLSDGETQKWAEKEKLNDALEMARKGLQKHFDNKKSSRYMQLDRFDNSKIAFVDIEAKPVTEDTNMYNINF